MAFKEWAWIWEDFSSLLNALIVQDTLSDPVYKLSIYADQASQPEFHHYV